MDFSQFRDDKTEPFYNMVARITMRSLFRRALYSQFRNLGVFFLGNERPLFPGQLGRWDGCCNFGYGEQLEVPLLRCLGRCSDFSPVTYNPALVRTKQCLKRQHKPSAPRGRCKDRPIAAGTARNVTFRCLRFSLFFSSLPSSHAQRLHRACRVEIQGNRHALCCLGSPATIAAALCQQPGIVSRGTEVPGESTRFILPFSCFCRSLHQQLD